MARDDIKDIIERGRQIPCPNSQVLKPAKGSMKKAKEIIIERPKERQMVRAIRTISGVRK